MSHHDINTPDFGAKDKTFFTYTLGIVLCVILTLIPFGAVHYGAYSYGQTLSIIYISAVLQFFVQVICFLRLNYSTFQAKLNVLSFVFTICLLSIVVAGSIWIMYNLDYFMMH